jgi:Cys-tRNA synthase (O-phospho-L-seryl-tRNA:Cys-tRNA synthase)
MCEEPVSWERVEGNTYAVVFKAPANKDYKEIRILMGCSGNSIDLITVMRNNETVTNRQKRQYQSDKDKEIEKKRLKAMSKRKW